MNDYKQSLKKAYVALQVLAGTSTRWAVDTDSMRAQMRNEIAQNTDRTAQQVQEECEELALKIRMF